MQKLRGENFRQQGRSDYKNNKILYSQHNTPQSRSWCAVRDPFSAFNSNVRSFWCLVCAARRRDLLFHAMRYSLISMEQPACTLSITFRASCQIFFVQFESRNNVSSGES